MNQLFKGLIGAACTPMRENGSVNIKAIDRQAQLLVDNAVPGVLVCGTTGEFASLTLKERLAVARRWGVVAGMDLKVMVNVGDTCLQDCKQLAASAQRYKADAIAAVPPYYFKPANLAMVIDFCAAIAAAAPKLPFYYYHIPELTGVEVPIVKFLGQAPEKIPTLAGVKFTSDDLTDFGRCVDAFGKTFNLLVGRDDMLLAGLKMGAHGGVGGTYNIAAPLYMRIVRALEAGDMGMAQNHQVHSVEMLAVLRHFGVVPAIKAAMRLVGVDCGPVRPPFARLGPEQLEQMDAELDRIGFGEFASRH